MQEEAYRFLCVSIITDAQDIIADARRCNVIVGITLMRNKKHHRLFHPAQHALRFLRGVGLDNTLMLMRSEINADAIRSKLGL